MSTVQQTCIMHAISSPECKEENNRLISSSQQQQMMATAGLGFDAGIVMLTKLDATMLTPAFGAVYRLSSSALHCCKEQLLSNERLQSVPAPSLLPIVSDVNKEDVNDSMEMDSFSDNICGSVQKFDSVNNNNGLSSLSELQPLSHKKLCNPNKERLKRMCPYCSVYQTNLQRHIRAKHLLETAAQELKKVSPKIKKKKCMQDTGDLVHNNMLLANDTPKVLPETLCGSQSSVKECKECHSFLSKNTFSQHKCPKIPRKNSIDPTILNLTISSFKTDVLDKLENDKLGCFCQGDAIVKKIGEEVFKQSMQINGNHEEVAKAATKTIHFLARLFFIFCEDVLENQSKLSIEDMFKTCYVKQLQIAIVTMTPTNRKKEACDNTIFAWNGDEDGMDDEPLFNKLFPQNKTESPSMKRLTRQHRERVFIGNVLKQASESLLYFYMLSNNSDGEKEIDNFRSVLPFIWRNHIAPSECYLSQLRETWSASLIHYKLAGDGDAAVLAAYCKKRMKKLVKCGVKDEHEFLQLRRVTFAYLAIFNRCGGAKLSRLTTYRTKVWINHELFDQADPNDRYFKHKQLQVQSNEYSMTSGRTTSVTFVFPVLFVPALKLLIDPAVRLLSNIAPKNVFVFASRSSITHVENITELRSVCSLADVTWTTLKKSRWHLKLALFCNEYDSSGSVSRDTDEDSETPSANSSQEHHSTPSANNSQEHHSTPSANNSQEHHMTPSANNSQEHHMTPSANNSQEHHMTPSANNSQEHHMTPSANNSQEHHMTPSANNSQEHHMTPSANGCEEHSMAPSANGSEECGMTRSASRSQEHDKMPLVKGSQAHHQHSCIVPRELKQKQENAVGSLDEEPQGRCTWSRQDTAAIRKYFHGYIMKHGRGNTGSLPYADEVMRFLAETPPLQSLAERDSKAQLWLIQRKVFNERKRQRRRVSEYDGS